MVWYGSCSSNVVSFLHGRLFDSFVRIQLHSGFSGLKKKGEEKKKNCPPLHPKLRPRIILQRTGQDRTGYEEKERKKKKGSQQHAYYKISGSLTHSHNQSIDMIWERNNNSNNTQKKKEHTAPFFYIYNPVHPTSLRFSQYVRNSFSQPRPGASHPLSRTTKSPSL